MTKSSRKWAGTRARARAAVGRAKTDGEAEAIVIARSYDPDPLRGTGDLRHAPGADVDAHGGDLDAFFRYLGKEDVPRDGGRDTIVEPVAPDTSLTPDSASLLRGSGG